MFVRAANPIWYMVDHVGQPLNDEYYAFFLTNTLPYLPKNVYRDPEGQTVWTGNIVQFQPSGTLPNNLYFDPNLVYRIEIRHGDTQNDALIWEINNFVPGDGATPDNNSLAILGSENQISNSQFSEINFVSPLTISTAGTYNIAPGWDLVLTGTGTMTVTQIILSGSQFPLNPPPPFPYALRFASTGWTSALLVQRFDHNGSIWSLGAITASLTGIALTSDETISVNYVPSDGNPTPIILNETLGTAAYQVLSNAVDVNFTNNTDLSDDAYVDIQIVLPTTGTVELSNIQIIGQSDPLPSNFDPATDIPSYQQETNERMIDHLFHYYRNEFLIKPKKSLLVGWNFPLNPFQFITGTLTTVVNETSYICDQTILHQEAASQLQSGQLSLTNRLDLGIKAVAAATQTRFALIQYIDPSSIRAYWGYVLSAFARARIFTSHNTSVRLKCRLIYRSSLPSAISATEPIASWGANADPTFSAGWTALAPLNDPAYVLPNAYADDEVSGESAYPGFAFNQFQLPNADNANMTLGIVIYTMDNLDATALSEDSIGFDKISLIPSKFGADATPQTYDECLRECEFYYEKSYSQGVLPGTNTETGIRHAGDPLGGDYSSTVLYKNTFNLVFNQIKRSPSTVHLYAVDGTIDNVRLGTMDGNLAVNNGYPTPDIGTNPVNVNISQWSVLSTATTGVVYRPANTTSIMTFNSTPDSKQGEILYHYTADARLGV